MSRWATLRAGGAALLAVVAAAAASAWIPSSNQIANAFAKESRSAGRGRPLALEVAVFVGDREEPVGHGTLVSDPAGRARMELTHQRGFVERHLRRPGGVQASRDGEVLDAPRPLLPPLWLLQATGGGRVLSRLAELGGDPARVVLGYDGDHDCWVIGGRDEDAVALWIDQDTLAAARLDLPGVRYRFGPDQQLEGVRVPTWISIDIPGRDVVVLEVRGAVPTELAPDAFQPGWLRS